MNQKILLKEQSGTWIQVTKDAYDSLKTSSDYEVKEENGLYFARKKTTPPTPTPTPTAKPKPNPPSPAPSPVTTVTEVNWKPVDICDGGKVVKKGIKGPIVRVIQKELGFSNPDSDFGSTTEGKVLLFQEANGIFPSGIVDAETWQKMFPSPHIFACPVKPLPKVKPKYKDPDILGTDVYIGEQSLNYKPTATFAPVTAPSSLTGDGTPAQKPVNNPPQGGGEMDLKRVVNVGCLDRLKQKLGFKELSTRGANPRKLKDGRDAIVGIGNEEGQYLFFYADGKGEKKTFDVDGTTVLDNVEFEWDCPQLRATTSATADVVNMNEDQSDFVNDLIEQGNGLYQTQKPSAYQESQGNWVRKDLYQIEREKTQRNEVFKTPGKFFVWQKSGVAGKAQDRTGNAKAAIEAAGWTFDEPDNTTLQYKNGRLVSQQFPDYKDLFRKDQMVWYVGKDYSTKEKGKVVPLVQQIINDPGLKIEREICRAGIDALYDAIQNPQKVYFEKDSDLFLVKDYVKRCNMTGNRRWRYLNSNRAGTRGVLRYFFGESKEELSSLIRKKLVETKLKKENETVGKQIVESRLKMILESIKKEEKVFSKKKVNKSSIEFIKELNDLNNQGLINETLGDSLQSIFGKNLESMPQTFFEQIFGRILSKLEMEDSFLKNKLVSDASTNPTETIAAMKDCDSMTMLIAKTISDSLHMNLESETNVEGQGWDTIRNLLGQEVQKAEFMEKIKDSISGDVCAEFSKITNNSQNLLSRIKGANGEPTFQ